MTTDSGNTLALAKDLGDLTYDVTALGTLRQQEISETVGGEADAADFFKFSLSQSNGIYLNLSATTNTRFQLLNASGSVLGTVSAGSSNGQFKYMLNLDAGTYYLKASTADSSERASYIMKTVLAPVDSANDDLSIYAPVTKLGSLGANGTLSAQSYAWWGLEINSEKNYYDNYSFTLTSDAKVRLDLSALKNAGFVSLRLNSQNGSDLGTLSINANQDSAFIEKQLLAGTYNIQLGGDGVNKYDAITGTSGRAPTKYELKLTSTPSNATATDSGNTLALAKDLGDLTYDVTALGTLRQQEISETVGGEADAADFFKFSLSQSNGIYLNLSATTNTRFQLLNASGSVLGTVSAGSSNGQFKYMLNLDAGTYYLKASTADSSERASYIMKTVLAPVDSANDDLSIYAPVTKLGSLGANGTLSAQSYAWWGLEINSEKNYYDNYSFTLTSDAKVRLDLSALKNAGFVSLRLNSQNGSDLGTLSINANQDSAFIEKQLLAGTYNIQLGGDGVNKYDAITGTSGRAPTKYELKLTSTPSNATATDSGNTLALAKDLGDLTYDVTALGTLRQQEISETVGGEADAADFFKFSLSQSNGIYLNLSATTNTRFQLLNASGSVLGTVSAGSSNGQFKYMLNLDAGTYYLKASTADSSERASYIMKTVLAPVDSANDDLSIYAPVTKLGSLGANGTLSAQSYAWWGLEINSEKNYYDNYSFTLTSDAKVRLDLSALKNAGFVSLRLNSQNGSDLGTLSINANQDSAFIEKQLLAGTYNIQLGGDGVNKYDAITGTSGRAPTKYELKLTTGTGSTGATAPTLTISSDKTALEPGETAVLSFGFSKPVTGFALADIQVSAGTVSGLTVSSTDPTKYTATYTAAETASAGTAVLVSVAQGSYQDLTGSSGSGATFNALLVGSGPVTPPPAGGETGNTLALAKDLGNLTYDLTTLGMLKAQEISETVGGDSDPADFFKFSLTQPNGLYLNLSATTNTKFQVLNTAGTLMATVNAGSSSGQFRYMLNLEAGTYYLKTSTVDSTERASYIMKTVLAPTDPANDNFAIYTPTIKLGNLGTDGTLSTQAHAWSGLEISDKNGSDSYSFTLTADAKVRFDLSSLKNASYTSLNLSSQNGSNLGALYIDPNRDTAFFEKQLLAGTYNLQLSSSGTSKYDAATGTYGTAPTKYELKLTASASNTAGTDSGNTLALAKDLGNLTYDLTTLGMLKAQEISETVGGDSDPADFFKFSLTQPNGLYLNLSATTNTKFQVLNTAGTLMATVNAGSSSGQFRYMLNLEAGTYYLKTSTVDSTERASYIMKTVLAPTDPANDNFAIYTPTIKLGNLGTDGTLSTQAHAWSGLEISDKNGSDSYSFTLTADAKVRFDLSSLKNASYTSLNLSSQNGSNLGALYIDPNRDTAFFEKQLLAGTYNLQLSSSGTSKYDAATGTYGTAPTKYELKLTASASNTAGTDSGNTLALAKDLGNLTYDLTTLGMLKAQEISETVGGDSDPADFFKFSLTQPNGLYLNLSATTNTKFQVLNTAGTLMATVNAGSSSGQFRYMLNLEAGTYYLKTSTVDSTERASYIMKTVLAPTDPANDNFAIYTPTIKLGNLGTDGTLSTQAHAWSGLEISDKNGSDSYSFTLTADAKVRFDLSSLKNASYTSLNLSSQNGSNLGALYIDPNRDTAFFEKQLLAGTYNLQLSSSGTSKYDAATGTYGTAPTKYELKVSTGAGGTVVDTTPPTLSIFTDKTSVLVGDSALLSFVFSEKPVGFELSDITASHGTVSSLAVSSNDPTLYTASFTPASDAAHGVSASITVGQGSYQDGAGNPGAVATLNTLKVVVPGYSVSSSASTADEGGKVSFHLSTQNLAAGSVVPYSLSGKGITAGDIDGGLLSGTLKTDANGKASLAVGLLADRLTEGAETLIFTAGGQSSSVVIADTSTNATVATPGVVFTDAANLSTTEAGGKAQFKVALAAAPRHDVTLTLTSNDTSEGLFVSTASNGSQTTSASRVLTFTSANWNQAQTVSLIGVDDAETDGNVAYVISSRVTSNDLNYDGMRSGQGIGVPNLFVENVDDDDPDEVLGTTANDVLYGGPGPSDVYGFLGRDEMYGGKGDDRLYGGYSDDVLYGEDGNDSLEGEQGSDKLYGGSGKDSLTGGSGNDSLYGGDGDDVLDGQDGGDFMDGGKGADTYYVDNPGDVVTDSGGDGALDTVYIASYLGSTYVMGKGIVNGTLSGQAGPGGLSGNASDNKLEGNAQNNTLSGGQGSDTLAGGGGNDSIDGGEGTDTLVLAGNELDYTITTDASKLLTLLTSKAGGEVVTVSSVEFVQFKDTLKSLLSTVKGDTIAPTLSARAPAPNATNVATGSNLTLSFSESVQAGSGNIVLKKGGAATTPVSIGIGDASQVLFAGNTVVINPASDLDPNSLYTVEMGPGVVQDLSGNAYAGLSGYSFTTQAGSSSVPVANQFVGLSQVRLVKDTAGNKSTVSFSVTLNAGSLEGQKINGMLLDLDYDTTKVASARVSGVQYDNEGNSTPVWQFITPNLQGPLANGKIVALTNSDSANPVVVGGKTLDVTLTLNQALDSFRIGFNKQSANLYTTDGSDRVVGTSADVTAVPNTSYILKATTLHWKNLAAGTAKALPDVSFVKGSQTLKSSTSGQAVFEASADSQASLTVGKSVAESEQAAAIAAVNLTDAIGILKMIVGLPVNSAGAATLPYQVVAADFNRDGNVSLKDAIDVLKSVVGLSAPAPGWVVLDPSKVSSSLNMDSYNADAAKLNNGGWMSPSLNIDLDKTPEIQLVGVLAGDVDGSWAG